MNEQLDKMEKDLLHEADTKFKEKIDAIHTGIAEVDVLLAIVKQSMDQMKGDMNDADIFVSCKIMKQEVAEDLQPVLERIEDGPLGSSLELQTDENAKLIMEGKRKFALIKYESEYKEDIHIRTNTDTKPCVVLSMCALPDGSIVMADNGNKTLKKLDAVSNQVSTLIRLSDYPMGVCIVDNSRLAVSLIDQKKIQFVTLSDKVTLDKSFSVGHRCKGLAYCDGFLYVCCGGSRVSDKKEGRGHVEIYSINGEQLRCLYEDLGCPRYIDVINDGYNTTVYTSGRYKGVQVRGIDGVVKHRYPTVHGSDLPFCPVGTDQLCIREYTTGNIYIHTRNNKTILIQKNDLKGMPRCLYFDKRSLQLFVVVDVDDDEDDVIEVFKLKM